MVSKFWWQREQNQLALPIDLRSHKADSLPIQIPEVVEQKAGGK